MSTVLTQHCCFGIGHCQYLNGMFVTYNCFAFLFDKVLLEHCQYGSGMFTPHKSITSNSASLWAIFPLIALTNLWILGNNCQYRKHNINWHSWWFYVLWHLVYGVLLIIFLIFHLISGKIERFGSCLLTSQKPEKTSRQISIRLTSDSIPFVFNL